MTLLHSSLLLFLSTTSALATPVSLWHISIWEGPAPPPDKGPPLSFHALRDKSKLPYEVAGILGAYAVWICVTAILILIVGKPLRRQAQSSNQTLNIAIIEPRINPPPPSTTDTSTDTTPVSPLKNWNSPNTLRSWPKSPIILHNPRGSQTSMSLVDERVVEKDRAHNMNEMERLYAAVRAEDERRATRPDKIAPEVSVIPSSRQTPELHQLRTGSNAVRALNQPMTQSPTDDFPRPHTSPRLGNHAVRTIPQAMAVSPIDDFSPTPTSPRMGSSTARTFNHPSTSSPTDHVPVPRNFSRTGSYASRTASYQTAPSPNDEFPLRHTSPRTEDYAARNFTQPVAPPSTDDYLLPPVSPQTGSYGPRTLSHPMAPSPRDDLPVPQTASRPNSRMNKAIALLSPTRSKHSKNNSSSENSNISLRGLQISEPMETRNSRTSTIYSDDSAQVYSPGPPPAPPVAQPEKRGPSRAAPPPITTRSPAISSTRSLPFREAYASPPQSAPATRITFVERKDPMRGLGSPGTAGAHTPYTPYQPFTPLTPVTPSRLVTREERKRNKKMEGLKVVSENDVVQDDKDMW